MYTVQLLFIICINSSHHNQLKIFLSLKKPIHCEFSSVTSFFLPMHLPLTLGDKTSQF